MSWATSEVVGVLIFLLPGFVAAAVFYSLTPHLRPSDVERVLQALMFTVVGQAIVRLAVAVNFVYVKHILETQDLEIAINLLVGVVVGLVAAFFSNRDIPHRFFRRVGLTSETSHPSEWHLSLSRNSSCYVVLHFKDGRRLYGWPSIWPSQPDQGHFEITAAVWLSENGQSNLESHGFTAMLVPANEVHMVEFVDSNPHEESER